MRRLRSVLTWLAPLVVVVTLLAGCGTERPPEYLKAQGDGADGRVGEVAVTDALFVYDGPVDQPVVYRPGGTASLQATIVNEGAQPDRLVAVSSPVAGAGQVVGDGSLPPLHALTAGYEGPVASAVLPGTTAVSLVLTGLRSEIRAGLTYPVVFTFARGGELRLDLPVGNPDVPRPSCPLPPDGKVPEILTAPIGAPAPPTAPAPDCSSLR